MRERVEYEWRLFILSAVLVAIVLGLFGRIIYLGIINRGFLLSQSNIRSIREVNMPAHRGMITDRNGKVLAISIPVASVWVNPKLYKANDKDEASLSSLLGVSLATIKKKIAVVGHREFVYLKRTIPLEQAKQIMALHIPGVFLENVYKRYYPESDSVAHVVGFTNIDDYGQEGLELAYDSWLRGKPGKIKVVKDCLGNVIANLGVVNEPQQGRDLVLSIDRRIQYLAYSELKKTIEQFQADSGSVVVLAVKTGEILAMANMPSYNPNNRANIPISNMRNRAVTDVFEPGSTIKAFSIANALASGKYTAATMVDTNPGVFIVDGNKIYNDARVNHGMLSVKEILQKSSNIGVAKITLSLPSNSLLNMLRNLGFGQSTQSGFPGEVSGVLPDHLKWRPFVLATLSFGYSISSTALQIVQAYATVAAGGLYRSPTFLKTDKISDGRRVLPTKLCQQMLNLLESVLDIGGTGTKAQIPGYKVAGKTGTAYIASPHGGYYADRYYANFIGLAPVSDPQIVIGVIIKNPHGKYHGSDVAAPAFTNIMNGTLRILSIPMDAVDSI